MFGGLALPKKNKVNVFTVFDLITAQTPISTQSSNSVQFQITTCVHFVYFFIKAYVVATNLNCIDLFKLVLTTYAFINEYPQHTLLQ